MMLAASGPGPLAFALDPSSTAQLRPAYCIAGGHRRAAIWQLHRRRPGGYTAVAAASGGSGGDSYKSPPSDLRDTLSAGNIDIAADVFAKGAAEGEDSDELVAAQLGAGSAGDLSDTQERYKDKIKAKLEERAEELRREREARAVKFIAGQNAYGRGQYAASVALFESALNEEGPFSQLGGEIQMWLALAYQACGREEECIETYKTIEKTHPVPAIRRKAAGLRYIMEAPKLELKDEEKVKIPVLTDLDPNRGGRAPPPRPRIERRERPKSWDEEFWENYEPPKYLKNKYVWAAAAIVTTGLAYYSALAGR